MPRKEKRPGKEKPGSSIVLRLNLRLLLRQVGTCLTTDLLLLLLAWGGLVLWADRQCADVSLLVAERGVPSAEATEWMAAGDYTVRALEEPPQGSGLWIGGLHLPFPSGEGELRREEVGGRPLFFGRWGAHPREGAALTASYANGGDPYAIALDLESQVGLLVLAGRVLLLCQLAGLLWGTFRNAGIVRKTLRPLQELSAAAARLGSAPVMSPEELAALAGRLDQVDATHLDARIPLSGTQKELRALAQAINAMLERIDAAYRSQTRFVSDASHELRTPIAVIQGYADLLDRWGKDDPATRQEAIDAIRSEASAMKELVEQLLFLARGDNDTMRLDMTDFDLAEVAAQVLRETEMIDPAHLFSGRWPREPVPVHADLGLVKQALRVLVDNSVKYTPAGGRISLRVEAEGDRVRLSVQDEGQGIDPESLPHIFDRFFRTDQSRARQTGGTGLGLSIAKWIVDRHGGWFEVLSREGLGTRMTVVLPLARLEGEGAG